MILLDNYNILNVSFTTTGNNVLACKSLEEEHYDIYSIDTEFGKILKESVSTNGSAPFVVFNVNYNGTVHENVKFLVDPAANVTTININNLNNSKILNESFTDLVEIDEFAPLPVFEAIDVVKEQLQRQKAETINILQEDANNQLKHVKQIISNVIQEGLDKINNTIDSHKTNVLSEIYSAKNDNLENNYGNFLAEMELSKQKIIEHIEQSVIDKQPLLNEYAEKLTTDIKDSFQKYVTDVFSKNLQSNKKSLTELKTNTITEINNTINTLIESVKIDLDTVLVNAQSEYNKNVNVLDEKVENTLSSFRKDLVDIKQNLPQQINENVNNLIEGVKIDFGTALINTQSECNEHVSTLDEKVKNNLSSFRKDLVDIKQNLPQQINENIEEECSKSIKPLITDIIENLRLELIELVKDKTSKSSLFEQTKNAAVEKVTHIITEAKGDNKSLEKTLKEYKDNVIKEIQGISQQYSVNMLRRIEMSSGGGTVAKQFANGGTMNGSLNVVGQILSGGVDISTLFGTSSGGGGGNADVNTLVINNSANWNSTYTTVGTNSANWSNVFTTVNANSALWGLGSGGSGSPGYYGVFYDTGTQRISTSNSVSAISANTTFESNGVTLSSNSRFVFANAGVYNINYNVQLDNSNANGKDASIWIRRNGSNVTNTTEFITVPGIHAGIVGHSVVTSNLVMTLAAGDYIEIYWSTANNADISLESTTSASTSIPNTPSFYLIATQVATLSSFGNVTGPVSSVNNSIARFSNGTGKVITDSANSTIDDNGNAVFAGTLSANGDIFTTQYVHISSTTFTGITATATTSLTALNTFLQVTVNGSTKYLRLFDIS